MFAMGNGDGLASFDTPSQRVGYCPTLSTKKLEIGLGLEFATTFTRKKKEKKYFYLFKYI
jgi:hypothetical protein